MLVKEFFFVALELKQTKNLLYLVGFFGVEVKTEVSL